MRHILPWLLVLVSPVAFAHGDHPGLCVSPNWMCCTHDGNGALQHKCFHLKLMCYDFWHKVVEAKP